MNLTETEPVTQETLSPQAKPSKRFKKRYIFLTILGAVLVWVGFDLLAPRTSHLREFNPDEVARLETAMWRSYYDKERVKLFNQMSELLRTQYNLPLVRSNTVAYQAAKAAFVFKEGHNRAEYEKALPNLISYYQSIHKVSDIDFDIEQAAKLELEWWIVHRERKQHAPGDLDRALADLPAEIYGIPPARLMEHARLRPAAPARGQTPREKKPAPRPSAGWSTGGGARRQCRPATKKPSRAA